MTYRVGSAHPPRTYATFLLLLLCISVGVTHSQEKPPGPLPAPVGVDLRVSRLEITQGIQGYDNSVPLISGKATYVRAFVENTGLLNGPIPGVLGQMYVRTRLSTTWTGPIAAGNLNGRITVPTVPDRGKVDDAFFFLIPVDLSQHIPSPLGLADLEVCVDVNSDHAIQETNYSNNRTCESVTFDTVDVPKIAIFDVQYLDGSGRLISVPPFDQFMLEAWLHRGYPVADIQFERRILIWPYWDTPAARGCGAVDNLLAQFRALDGPVTDRRYYGMVDDSGGNIFMRGCAAGIPSFFASGPTGTNTWGWDYDGTYGDWYGGHEIAHTYGRYHADFCGAQNGVPYPYPNGQIGGPASDPRRFYGWDDRGPQVFGPDWTDVMTYCEKEWVSDFTYLGLAREFHLATPPTCPPWVKLCPPNWINFAIIIGSININKVVAGFDVIYHFDHTDISPPIPSLPTKDWQIVFFNAQGRVLAKYGFTPREHTDRQKGEDVTASIVEAFPWPKGTAKISVLFKGKELAAQRVSAHAPQVTIKFPTGGELLQGEVTVRWEGTHPDNNPLSYVLQYSPDAGHTWRTLAVQLSRPETKVNFQELPGSDRALLRVIASDGVNTGMTVSRPLRVAKKSPEVSILSPRTRTSLAAGKLVTFTGEAYDAEDGSLKGESLIWSSSRDGRLGTGTRVSARLSQGLHTITLSARDSDGNVTSASIEVEVGRSEPK